MEKLNVTIASPISQVVCKAKGGVPGFYQQLNITKKSMSVKAFSDLSNTEKFATPEHKDFEELEKLYWDTVNGTNPPIYGADVCGSITDNDCDVGFIMLTLIKLF